MAINPGVAEIQDKRRKLLDGLDANEGFEEGLHEAAKDQYAGKCHFIYELLQNAGDAGATEVEFTLSRDALEFRHNGARLFKIEDVNSITNYHRSTKRGEDYEAVGKFGMGFKSVFFYTTTPEIHSGDYHFRIERMFYPATEGVRTNEQLDGWTKFTFPFEHKNRKTSDILAEVKQGLSEIRGETLLFMRKIRKIECLFDDGRHLLIERQDKDHIVRIKRTGESRTTCVYYLKFTKSVNLNGGPGPFEIGIAYGLDADRAMLTNGDMDWLTPERFAIKPLRGKVFVYFPAEKEISNLQFHINAPFATPMSREALTENRDNEFLLRELAKLAVESLPYLRDNKLLKTETLAVFPIDKDQLPDKYNIFQREIVHAFNTQDLTPTKSGSFKRADALIRSENRVSDLFSDEEVAKIYTQYRVPIWVKAPMVHTREDEFLSSLDLETFGNQDLEELVTVVDEASDNLLDLLDDFDDKHLLEFYKKIVDLDIKPRIGYVGGRALRPIFRANDNNLYYGFELYFGNGSSSEKFLKKIYRDDDSKLIGLFRAHGVKDYSYENVLRENMCVATPDPDSDAICHHFRDVAMLIAAYKANPYVVSKFEDFPWLCTDAKGRPRLSLAADVLIDVPYENTGMMALRKAYPKKFVISDLYNEKLSKEDFDELCKIVSKYDFVRGIRESYIEKNYFYTWGHPRHSELDLPPGCRQRDPWYRDCEIIGFEDLIRCINDDISRRFWKLLVSLHGSGLTKNPFKAICHHSGSCTRMADSLLVCNFQEKAWIKGVDGKWHKPADVTFAMIDSMYGPREMCDGLRAVKFGESASKIERANAEKSREIANFIKSMGAASGHEIREAVELMRAAKKHGIDIKGQILKKQTAAEMPESESGNVKHRQERARDDYGMAGEQTREMRERSVKTSQSMAPQARERLLRDYTDDAHHMRCQLCRQQMPFNKRDGRPYFECEQIFRDMKKESPDQYLALCPNCQAAYDEWIRKHENNASRLRQEILSRDVKNGQGAISIQLPDYGTPGCPVPPTRGMALYFVATHFADLKFVLEEEEL